MSAACLPDVWPPLAFCRQYQKIHCTQYISSQAVVIAPDSVKVR